MYSSDVLIQALINGALLGLVYALVAIGFTLLLGVMNYTNFAHGQLTMLAMYLAFVAYTQFGVDPFLAGVVTVPVIAAIAALIYFTVGRKAVRSPESTQVLSTIGLLLIFQSVAILIWGPTDRAVDLPYSNAVFEILGVRVSHPLAWAAGVALAVVAAVMLFLRWTYMGKALRATASNRTGAVLAGVNADRVFMGAMVLAGTLEGIAGTVIMPISVVTPFAGFAFILKAFVIVVVSGLGSVGGALIVSIGLGLVEGIANLAIGSKLSTAVIFLVLITSMILRPQGLFSRGATEHV